MWVRMMSRKIKLNKDDLAWLRGNHNEHTHTQIAVRLGVCVDTAKRILMRLELQYFPGAKYQTRPSVKGWTRPCITCSDEQPRPKNQYKCDECNNREAEVARSHSKYEDRLKRKPSKLEIPF